jgi:nucleoside-diphosphate-sugar epimerase
VTDVRDVVEGLVRMAERGVRSTVNLGTGTAVSLAEMIAAVGTAVGRPVATVVEPAGIHEPSATLADTTRCKRLLGFVPTTDITELVARQAAATTALLEAT